MKFNLILFVTLILLFSGYNSLRSQPVKEIKIDCSNKTLVTTFNWAKEKACSFVQTGIKGPLNVSERNRTSIDSAEYIPSYWAGYPLRTAFYSRDFCHQATGAHLLGLEDENFSMLKAFAASADRNKKWYPLWAINFDGSPYILDYHSDDNFVREVPAVFELVEKTNLLYKWTGDKRYIENDTIWQYCKKAVTDFIELHDQQIPNGVAEGTGKGIFQGASTYNEQHDVPLIEAGDGIASQYKAFHAFAELAEARDEHALSKDYFNKAEKLKAYFNSEWGIQQTDLYNRGYNPQGEPVDGWGKENSWFMPMKGITDAQSKRTKKYLDFIHERLKSKDDIPDNIEAISYVPEVFFLNHRDETGWEWMQHIISNIDQEHVQSSLTGTNGNYPEVSFVLISNIVQNMLGIVPNSAKNSVTTFSHLPADIEFLEARNIKIGNSLFSLKHQGKHTSVLHYLEGESEILWEAGFQGNREYLFVNEEKTECSTGVDWGKDYSYCLIKLQPGEKIIVSANNRQ
jgi:hypothetical protein